MQNKRHTVVIVDDSSVTINQLVPFFNGRMGFDVVAVGNDGNAALELYRTFRPDIITLDITMPNKDGYAATLDIINEFPKATIVIISALVGEAILRCLAAGAKAYIAKPIKLSDPQKMEDMESTIRALLQSPS